MSRSSRPSAALAALGWALCAGAARAAPAPSQALQVFEEAQVSVTTKSPRSSRRAPGIVTVITREEVQNSGARGLMDLLLQVPGFYFGADTQGVVGLGFRGNWAHEGKVALLIDGQPMTELDYGNLQFGNHYPVADIDRIEIIRGPGSVVYGGFAELAVINVITRPASDLRGGTAEWSTGRMNHAVGHSDVSLDLGGDLPGAKGVSATLFGLVGQGNRSDGTYRDFSGQEFPMAGNDTLDPRWLNASLKVGGLSLRAIADGYKTGVRDGFGAVGPKDAQSFPAAYLEAKYAFKPAAGLTITPQFNYQWQKPWLITNKDSPLYADRTLEQYTGALTASYDALESLSLLAGVSGYEQRAKLNDPTSVGIGLQRLFADGGTSAKYHNVAAYGQAVYAGELADLTVGARYERSFTYGSSFVPRAALTKVMGPAHAKLLYSQAFRVPVVQNLNLNTGIKPEKTTVWELEAGYQVSRTLSATVNLFDITIKDPIVFASQMVGGALVESYYNFHQTGSRGAEAALRFSHARGYANASYSFATSAGKNTVDRYEVPGRSDMLLAAPMHKATLSASVRTVRSLYVSPSVVVLGERFAFRDGDGLGNGRVGRIATTALLNLFLSYQNAWVPGLDLGVGVRNVLNEYDPFPQPYNGGHAPLPGPSREYDLRVSYSFRAP